MEENADMQYIFQMKLYRKLCWVDSSTPSEKCEIVITKISELYHFSTKARSC